MRKKKFTYSREDQFWSVIPSTRADRSGWVSFKNSGPNTCLAATYRSESLKTQKFCKDDDDSQLFFWV